METGESEQSKPSNSEDAFNRLKEELLSSDIPVSSVLDFASREWRERQDHEAFVMYTRAALMLMREPQIIQRLKIEQDEEFERTFGTKLDRPKIIAAIKAKDGVRRVAKLGQLQVEAHQDGASLITASSTFAEALEQYSALLAHVEELWGDACKLYRERHYPLSTFLSILTIEELGKLGRLWYDLLSWDKPDNSKSTLGLLGRDHRKKHFMGVMAGAVVNTRLDRILGLKEVRKLLQDVESGKLEQLRQSCLYIDVADGRVVKPGDVVNVATARFFAILSGELWAETLGHFPWEFQRMIGKVTAFEIEIGVDPAIVERS
ncbi:AbiV family abortive infection protein [Bradyrhizobium iriomotense]|uniref:AbiV family abortive infection protein n=1 Tax=Bradyrhizobium iriomotense TaxID=441950 RepID=UPI001B8A41C0|nr:AbiV family abortive infection protein [Bradyrhizobium iriomotense]MBR0787383.1 AbiV family abortive infection protein [Bradyrhizobium iriomotense]